MKSFLTKQEHSVGAMIRESRIAQALEDGVSRYPIYRVLRFAARVELDVLLDAIALDTGWRAERVHAESILLDADGLFVVAYGSRKADYCSCSFYIWAADLARAEVVHLAGHAGELLLVLAHFVSRFFILKKCVVPRRASPPPPPSEPRACGTRS